MNDTAAQITQLLSRLQGGDNGAAEQLMPLLYAELHARASAMMRRESEAMTLQPTALLHEAWVRLQEYSAGRETTYTDRTHFLRLAGKVMRNVLVDHARRRNAQKRDQAREESLLTGFEPEAPGGGGDRLPVLALDEALGRLAQLDARKAQVVELRCFGGLSMPEVAAALEVSLRTVEADWFFARAWLKAEVAG